MSLSDDMRLCFQARTVQGSAVKTLVETLKELLTDTVLEVTQRGIRVIAMDSAHVVLVHLRLEHARFEYFDCTRPSLHLAVNMLNLHKLLKTLGSSDTLGMYVEEEDMNHLYLQIEKSDKCSKTVYRLNLLDMDNLDIHVPSERFDNVIVLGSVDFQKLCRDMGNLSDRVEIKVTGNEVVFGCRGEFCTQETVFGGECLRNAETGEPAESGGIVQGVFPLKYLGIFTRCTNLCSTVELYFKNNYPLIVRYSVSTLGEIKLVCAQLDESALGH